VGVLADKDTDARIYHPKKNIRSEGDNDKCVEAFFASGFSLLDTANYEQWFDAHSIVSVSESGLYKGPKNIADYVSFTKNKELLDYYEIIANEAESFIPLLTIVANRNDCVLTYASVATMATTDVISNGGVSLSMDVLVGARLKFSIVDATTILVHRNDLYFPRSFSNFFWGEAIRSKKTAKRNCKIMMNSCSSTFESNCYTKEHIDECVNDMLALPGVDSDGAVDGKSMACRTLHAALDDGGNKDQCQRISFDPRYDVDCQLKCQETANLTAEDLFLPEELELFATFSDMLKLGPKQWKSPGSVISLPEE